MPAALSDLLAEQVDLEATIDGNQFLTISKLLYKATVNEPRSVTVQISDNEYSFFTYGLSSNPPRVTHTVLWLICLNLIINSS